MSSLRTTWSTVICSTFALAALGASPQSIGLEDRVELPAVTWSAGDIVQADYRSNSVLRTMVIGDGKLLQEFDSIEERNSKKIVRVLAVDERGPTRVRVEYGTMRSVQERVDTKIAIDDEEAPDEVNQHNPLEQRTFTLVRQARGFKVLDANDARVPEGLARLVLEEEGLGGSDYIRAGDHVARELVKRSLVIGTEYALGPEAAHAFVEDRTGRGDMRLFVTPKGTREEDGTVAQVFATRLTIHTEGAGPESDTDVELRGETRFDANSGQFLSIHLDGVLSIASATKDDAHTIEVTGQGPWSIRETARYEQVR